MSRSAERCPRRPGHTRQLSVRPAARPVPPPNPNPAAAMDLRRRFSRNLIGPIFVLNCCRIGSFPDRPRSGSTVPGTPPMPNTPLECGASRAAGHAAAAPTKPRRPVLRHHHVSPKETFRSVVAHPRWFGMLALDLPSSWRCCVGGYHVHEVGQQAWLDSRSTRRSSFGGAGQRPACTRRCEKMAPYAGYSGGRRRC